MKVHVLAGACFAVGSLSSVTSAWSLNRLRKAAASAVVAGTMVATPVVGVHAVDFTGSYADPKHPGCERNINVPSGSSVATLTGTDGTPGCNKGEPTRAWKLMGEVKSNEILVDFSPKGGPKNLEGVWDGDGIKWPDGNKWSLVSVE